MRIAGTADLPLHDGHVPAWLAAYMRRLAKALALAVAELYGPSRLVEFLSDPIWFQAFNNAIGMDWDSSGSTTVTLGILKQVAAEEPGIGLVVAGGKGSRSREAPREIQEAAEKGLIPSRAAEEAVAASRLAAKTDSVLLQDGYTLYHHSVIISSDGKWAIIQQGMNPLIRMARRYHWLGPLRIPEPSLEPHSGIASQRIEAAIALDLTSKHSREARKALPEIVSSTSPRRLAAEIHRAYRLLRGDASLEAWLKGGGSKPFPREVRVAYYRPQPRPPRDIERRLAAIREASPDTIEELVMVEGVGPATLRSIALVAELIYGVPVSHRDPATAPIDPFRYAYIAGGKDGVPFPFRADYAEKVLEFLGQVVEAARLDEKIRKRVIERLRRLAALLPK